MWVGGLVVVVYGDVISIRRVVGEGLYREVRTAQQGCGALWVGNARRSSAHGEVLQLRPKAANSKALTEAVGAQGEPILTLPRGFYLKKNFTGALLARHFLLQT